MWGRSKDILSMTGELATKISCSHKSEGGQGRGEGDLGSEGLPREAPTTPEGEVRVEHRGGRRGAC